MEEANRKIVELGGYRSGVVIERINSNNLKDLSKEFLHRDNYYLSILCQRGGARFFVEFDTVQVHSDTLFFLSPGQLHKLVSFHDISGWLLMFDPKIISGHSRGILDEGYFDSPTAILKREEAEFFNHVFGALANCSHNDLNNPEKYTIINLFISVIVQKTSQIRLNREKLISSRGYRAEDITRQFMKLLRNNCREFKKSSDYAKLMSFSTGYLNDTIKNCTGFSTTYLIQQEIMREAQRLLYRTTLSIKQIAYELNFDDEKYFNRLFNKVCGVSPGSFRREWNKDSVNGES